MISVKSSNIKAVDYKDGDLVVQFHNGSQYRYSSVPMDIYQCLLLSKSKGAFFSAHIKGKFECKKEQTDGQEASN